MPGTPLGLYVHLPFCPSRCPYCDFYALPFQPGLARRLVPAVLRHLEMIAPLAQGRHLASLYVGGGTPSLLPAAQTAQLVSAARDLLGLEPLCEISLEANPGTLGQGKLLALRQAGFNRLSLGAQSFDALLLKLLGRRHTPFDTRRAVKQARTAGFSNLSLDLIYGLPGQGLDQAQADLRAALELEPDHISLYELTLSPETPYGRAFRKGQPPLPDEDEVLDMEDAALETLEKAGLVRYEVSNFAKPGHECRHNQDTWRGGDYLALGPAAHGHLAGRRWGMAADVEAYLAGLLQGREPLEFSEDLSPRQRALELVMLGLRTTRGVNLTRLGAFLEDDPRRFWARPLAQIIHNGWARLAGEHLIPTRRGLRLADAAAALFA